MKTLFNSIPVWEKYQNSQSNFEEYKKIISEAAKDSALQAEKQKLSEMKLKNKIAEWSTVLICSKDIKDKLIEAMRGSSHNVTIISSSAIRDNTIYEVTDVDLKRQLMFGDAL